MTIDICIPFYKNIECLSIVAWGLKSQLRDRNSIGTIVLHIQEPHDEGKAREVFDLHGFRVRVASFGSDVPMTMATYMDRMFNVCDSPWVVMMEQDTFLHCAIDLLVGTIRDHGFVAAGPMDSMIYNNIHARKQSLYGEYARLSPQPGFFHSSLIILDRLAVAAKSTTPFTMPGNFKMHGTGTLGGESYYGLRVNLSANNSVMLPGRDRELLAFFNQTHSNYGYAADIDFQGRKIATHLYYSSTRDGYVGSLFSAEERDWIASEEKRFLSDYGNRELAQ